MKKTGDGALQIKRKEWLEINGEKRTFYGYKQNWYPDGFKRDRGCGPTVAAMLLSYINKRENAGLMDMDIGGEEQARQAMMKAWRYFTPTYALGLYSTKLFAAGARRFCREFLPGWRVWRLRVGPRPFPRPDPERAAAFIEAGLGDDCPVAFLSLSQGACRQLDSWHWILIVGMDGRTVYCYDNGVMKNFDLALWLRTSRLGGGFCWLGKGRD